MAHEALSMMDFSDRPAVLVLADGGAAAARATISAEQAGCRVVGSVQIADALGRMDRQASVDAIVLELKADGGKLSVQILDALQRRAARHGRRSVVAAPAALIDLVAARTPDPRVQHLCAPTERERTAAIAAATSAGIKRLHDNSKEQGVPRLDQLSHEAARIAAALADLAERQAQASHSGPAPAPLSEQAIVVDAALIRAMIRARRLRDQFFAPDLFADPAWDILLDLFAAKLEGQRVAVSSLCIAAAVPPTTALRWIKTLTDMGLLLRAADPQDGRRVYIELSDATASGLEAYLTAAHRISPLIL